MTGKPKNPNEENLTDLLGQNQQVADEGGVDDAESFANIEPDGAASFANINPVNE
jgi:hypothetical protein